MLASIIAACVGCSVIFGTMPAVSNPRYFEFADNLVSLNGFPRYCKPNECEKEFAAFQDIAGGKPVVCVGGYGHHGIFHGNCYVHIDKYKIVDIGEEIRTRIRAAQERQAGDR